MKWLASDLSALLICPSVLFIYLWALLQDVLSVEREKKINVLR